MLSLYDRDRNWGIVKLLAGLAILPLLSLPIGASAQDAAAQKPAAPAAAAPAAAAPAAAAPAAAAPAAAPAAPAATGGAAAAKPVKVVKIYYLGKRYPEPPPLSIAEPIVTDKGIQGARAGLIDNNRTGQFLGVNFQLINDRIPVQGDIVAKAKEILKGGDALIVADLEPKDLLAVADLPEAKNSIILNIRSSADQLRQQDCRYNVFHIIPSWAMRADALAQYLILKKWPSWFIMRGVTPADIQFANDAKRSAKRYGGDVVGERVYKFNAGGRRLSSGHQQIQTQMPEATEGAPEHDVIWVADTLDDFGDYLNYRSYTPRPIVGTQGLRAVAWDDNYTEYGGQQFNVAIEKLAHRDPTERDYTAWLAVRVLGDAVLHSGKTSVPAIREYITKDTFRVAGWKGEAMNFRPWDHQLRQPILLAGYKTLITISPQEGFMHPGHLTDTLGFDQPETQCHFKH
jgi:ABC transporter substrate binding protein (PQQ-dependent alcohol dehydrogenase system)